jgi:lysophospholipase L1-like esterase
VNPPLIKENWEPKRFWVQAVLVAFPVLVHASFMIMSVRKEKWITFARADLAFMLLVLSYVLVGAYVLARRRRTTGFVLLVYSLLASLALAEILARVITPAPPPARLPQVPAHFTATIGTNNLPGLPKQFQYSVNSMGLRGPEVKLERFDVRILCVGGSTTECILLGDDLTWPARLQDLLSRRLQQKVYVGNAGIRGHLSISDTYLLDHYEPAARFPWVIVLCGMNDLGSMVNRKDYDVRRRQVTTDALTPEIAADDGHRAYYRNLVLSRMLKNVVATWRRPSNAVVMDPSGAWLEEQRRGRQRMLKLKTFDRPPGDFDVALSTYHENLSALIRTCRRHGQHLLMLTQPTMYWKDLPPEFQLLLQSQSDEGAYSVAALEDMMNQFNQTMITVCRSEGVECLDLASLVGKDTSLFYDDCHFNAAGCEKVATLVADRMTQLLQKSETSDHVVRHGDASSVHDASTPTRSGREP